MAPIQVSGQGLAKIDGEPVAVRLRVYRPHEHSRTQAENCLDCIQLSNGQPSWVLQILPKYNQDT
jgi:hypothetical protein